MASHKGSAAGRRHSPPAGVHWLKALRAFAACLVLASFLVVFTDYRKWVEGWFIDGLAQTQIVPAWQSVLAGVGAGALALFLGFMLITLIFGRVYCSFLCPLGIAQDVVSRISRKLRWGKAKGKGYKYAKPVKWVRPFMILLIVVASVLGLGSVAWMWLDPYSQFGRLGSMILKPTLIEGNNALAESFDRPVSWLYRLDPEWGFASFGWAIPAMIVLLAVVFGMAIWKGRLYCNTICPVGAFLGLLSRYSMFRIFIDKNSCVKCALCMKSCKSQCIDLKTASIDFSRCVNCFNCVSVCEGRGIRYRFSWKKMDEPTPQNGKPSKGGDKEQGGKADSQAQAKESPPSNSPDIAVSSLLPPIGRRAFMGATATGLTALLVSCVNKEAGEKTKKEINSKAITPPGCGNVDDFLSACTGCQLCVVACPGNCLKPSYMEFGVAGIMKPHMQYVHGFCQFECTTCSSICPTGAIKPLTKEQKVVTQIGKADLRLENCIAANDKTDCGACAEHCPKGALEMVRMTQPVLDISKCVSCLKCKEFCPKGDVITYPAEGKKSPSFDYKKCIGCGTCVEVCEGDALTMRESQWNIRVPVLDEKYCIGCGGCEYICPPKTIQVKALAIHGTAETIVEEQVVNPNEGMDFPF